MNYVDFKLALKLKEKGYPQHIRDYDYVIENEYEDDFEVGCAYPSEFIPEHIPSIAAPRIGEVFYWLRTIKKIHICIEFGSEGWWYDISTGIKIVNGEGTYERCCLGGNVSYNSYEEASIEGIQYVLDNLILNMDNNKFKDLIEAPTKMTDDICEAIHMRGAIQRTVRLTLQYPELAQEYLDSIPKAVCEDIPTPS